MKTFCFRTFIFHFSILLMLAVTLHAQGRQRVWAEEFNSNEIDLSEWAYETGPSNDNIHYYTTRSDNVQIADGILRIIALEESFSGFDYTSGLIKTKTGWRYGRVEARINLPGGKGFVPAFWMLPLDNIYSWWPKSGEIDIMEHPTNEISNIYGSIHTETYNNFGGIGNEGDVTVVADAESAFHVYAIEWDENKIDFYVDDTLYYTFTNDQKGSASWPFDEPFYIILNLAVGGGWVGDPDETTVFPAVMEVDWVRVYQYVDEIKISGIDYTSYNSTDIVYSIPFIEGTDYDWQVPGNAQINTSTEENQISVDWSLFGGHVQASVTTENGSFSFMQPVKVSQNLLKNAGFETGVKYWNSHVGHPAAADFSLSTSDIIEGKQSLVIDVQNLASNPWDIQISQRDITLESGEQYSLSFWAKSDNPDAQVNLTYINDNFYVYHSETFQLSDEWSQYSFDYSATGNDQVSLNIDMGMQTGLYSFDQFIMTTAELSGLNQIRNADFFENQANWNLTTLSTAQAMDTVVDGVYTVSITNGGTAPWDVHAGQSPVNIETGKEYTITFDAYSSAPRTIIALVGQNSAPWNVYHPEQNFLLSSEKQTFSYSFVMNSSSDSNARFGFDIGAATGELFFDNILVTAGSIPVGINDPKPGQPRTTELYQNYPNPFNPVTFISYYLSQPGHVELAIYNLLGQKLLVIESGHKKSGVSKKEFNAAGWPSGIYIYRLKVNNQIISSRKLLLLK